MAKANGELMCFNPGDDDPDSALEVPDGLGHIKRVAVGGNHTCAITADGCLFCFGSNEYSQCDVPPGLGLVTIVAAGNEHT
mgnify:CR=1 FL=1